MIHSSILACMMLAWPGLSPGSEVHGRVVMPAVCSPEISPAVAYLESIEPVAAAAGSAPRNVGLTLIERQHGLQFSPRVQAMRLGDVLKFTNEDPETHNVHLSGAGATLNESMSPGRTIEFRPAQPGVVRVLCDIHSHMRAFVIVSPTPWATVCGTDGAYRFNDVPQGKYLLHVWHEMGKAASAPIEIGAQADTDLGTIEVEGLPLIANRSRGVIVRPWAEVSDRIAQKLTLSLHAALKSDAPLARRLAEDAYWDEFEGSSMEIAVRGRLGFQRAGVLEKLFRDLRETAGLVAADPCVETRFHDQSRRLLLELHRVGAELNRKGLTDAAGLAGSSAPSVAEATGELPAATDAKARLESLAAGFARVARTANEGKADEASSLMSDAYFDAFEPLERELSARAPLDVARLEAGFSALRGRIRAGLQGQKLDQALAELTSEIRASLDRVDRESASFGVLGSAFIASLITLVREGVEVILILSMLIALAAKSGQAKAMKGIAWGVALALGASGLTALALNSLLASAQGRAREQFEGFVMLAAAGLLFYVSYWLIAQSEVKRWTEFLKRNAQRGIVGGGGGAFAAGATAFLAVYREGAETALMYQAMLVQAPRNAVIGVVAGIAVGVVLLALIYWAIRVVGAKLPMRRFFQVTSLTLFAMAFVFAGKGVSELQGARFLKLTPVAWLGAGIPALGIHPTVQGLSIQALLILGALLSLIAVVPESLGRKPDRSKPETLARPKAAVRA